MVKKLINLWSRPLSWNNAMESEQILADANYKEKKEAEEDSKWREVVKGYRKVSRWW